MSGAKTVAIVMNAPASPQQKLII